MRISTTTNNGVTSLELIGDSEKDIAILTEVFSFRRSALKRSFRFRARPTSISGSGAITAVTINNDAFLTKKYLIAVGFEVYKNLNAQKELAGYYYIKDTIVLYNRKNSNAYIVYKNAQLQRMKTWSLVQVDKTKPVKRIGTIRKVSELDYLK